MIHTGSLVTDAGRKIAKIDYDYNNNPVRIQFTNGNVTKYIYSATGEKLRVIYQTSVYKEDAEIVEIGKTKELSQAETNCTETIDYLLGGALTLRNGRIDKYQFEEGYCQAKRYNNTMDDFTFCYYDKDHLGDIRQVTEADGSKKGTIIKKMNYYPFGAEFCDAAADSLVQPYKYNGKEFDHMHGLNTYDYGARQYNPVTARWDRIDPLCEKFYNVSPYNYCLNNPIKLVDPDGKAHGPGDFFQTLDDAAKDFGLFYNDNSIRVNREFCSTAFLVKNKNGDVGYSYSIAYGGERKPPCQNSKEMPKLLHIYTLMGHIWKNITAMNFREYVMTKENF